MDVGQGVQLGFAVVVAGALIRFLMSLVRSYKNTVDNHIEHNTKVLVSISTVCTDLTNAIRENTNVLRQMKDK